MGACQYCGKTGIVISRTIGFCADCIREHFKDIWPEIRKVHEKSRRVYGLPEQPPSAGDGISCPFCFQECRIPEGGTGYCGLRKVKDSRLVGGLPHQGNLSYYYDPLPTNCVADFVCPAGTGCGYPHFARSNGPEYGYKNLAVFYQACSFNCLFCQNYHFKEQSLTGSALTAKRLSQAVDNETACICFFGGDPTPQILHAIKTSRLAKKRAGSDILRICWETNGAMKEPYLRFISELSLHSGGCIKFDLKAWDEKIHLALCGVTNRQTLDNFRKLAKRSQERPSPPFLIASTLLVPGYVDEKEISYIAGFIAGLNPDIPYSLLAFHPHFYLKDLPTTSRAHAQRCKEAAEREGVRHVHIGNLHLLGSSY